MLFQINMFVTNVHTHTHTIYPSGNVRYISLVCTMFFIRIKWGSCLRFSSLSSNVNRLPKKHGPVIYLFVLLRAKRVDYSIACKYIHVDSSIPYLFNQIGGRTRNWTNFKAAKCTSRNSRQPRWRIIHRKNNLSLATSDLLVRTLIISSEYLNYMSEFIYLFIFANRSDVAFTQPNSSLFPDWA